jgi:hypothetical protein
VEQGYTHLGNQVRVYEQTNRPGPGQQEGWIKAEWKLSENNRRAKFYSLTRLGRKELEKEAANWNRLSTAISRVVKLKEA